jgi:hypothetical protein
MAEFFFPGSGEREELIDIDVRVGNRAAWRSRLRIEFHNGDPDALIDLVAVGGEPSGYVFFIVQSDDVGSYFDQADEIIGSVREAG